MVWGRESCDIRAVAVTAETKKIRFKWASSRTDSPLGPRAHHPACPNTTSTNVLGAELTQGEESRLAWEAKANSTMTPGRWNSPGYHPLEMPLGQASASSHPQTQAPFFYSLCCVFLLAVLEVSKGLSLRSLRIQFTSVDPTQLAQLTHR